MSELNNKTMRTKEKTNKQTMGNELDHKKPYLFINIINVFIICSVVVFTLDSKRKHNTNSTKQK